MGKIQYVYDNITETAATISHADCLSSKVALHFNLNYWRPYLVVTFSRASFLSCSAATVAIHRKLIPAVCIDVLRLFIDL